IPSIGSICLRRLLRNKGYKGRVGQGCSQATEKAGAGHDRSRLWCQAEPQFEPLRDPNSDAAPTNHSDSECGSPTVHLCPQYSETIQHSCSDTTGPSHLAMPSSPHSNPTLAVRLERISRVLYVCCRRLPQALTFGPE